MMSAIPASTSKKTHGASTEMDAGMHMSHAMDNGHSDPVLPTRKLVAVLIATFALLALSLWITTLFAPVTFMRTG